MLVKIQMKTFQVIYILQLTKVEKNALPKITNMG